MSDKAINDIIAFNLNRLLELNGKNQADLATYMEVSQATVSNWCKGIKSPRMDKLDRICVFLNCTRTDLLEDKGTQEEDNSYYIDKEARELAQFLYENPKYKILFDAAKDVSADDLEMVKTIIDKFKK